MKSENEDADDDLLDDPIRLNLDGNPPRLDNLKFLDPGIIVLDYDEDCKYAKGDFADVISLPNVADVIGVRSRDTSALPVKTQISKDIVLKPMIIKLVDCYKFPWYVDQCSKKNIHKKSADDNRVYMNNYGKIMGPRSKKFVNSNTDIYDKDAFNNIDREILHVPYNELENDTNKYAYKTIDMNAMFNMGERVTNLSVRLANNQRRTEMELLRALSQRNKTKVDFKKNKGLVGIKIRQLTSEKSTNFEIKQESKVKDKNESETLNQFYVQAVDKAMIDMGTTITPIFKETQKNNKESERRVTGQKMEKYQHKETHTPSSDLQKTNKAVSNSKMEEYEKNKMFDSQDNQNGSKQLSNVEGCKMTKMITPLPLSPRIRKKQKFINIISTNTVETCESTEPQSPILSSGMPKKVTTGLSINNKNTQIKDYKNEDVSEHKNEVKPDSSNTSKANKMPKKHFSNRFTENILKKIRAQQKKLPKVSNNSTNEQLQKKHNIRPKCSNQTGPTNKCKSKQSSLSSKEANVRNDNQCTRSLDNISDTKNTIDLTKSQEISVSITETENIKNNKMNNDIPGKKKNSNPTKFNNLMQKLGTDIKQPSGKSKEPSLLKFGSENEVTNIEDIEKFIGNSKHMEVSTKLSHANTVPQIVKDKCPIQTIATSRNESDAENHTYKATNLTVHQQYNTKVSEIIMRPTHTTNHQAQMKNQPLAVHNSMRSHILYKPLAEPPRPPPQLMFPNNSASYRHQIPMNQMNQAIYQLPANCGNQYLPSYPSPHPMSINAGPSAGFPPMLNMNIKAGVNEVTSQQIGFNIPPRINEAILPQARINFNPSGFSRGIPPEMNIGPPIADIRGISPHIDMNIRSPGILPQIALKDSLYDDHSSNVIWSYMFPPPKPPPPPPPPPSLPPLPHLRLSSSELSGFRLKTQDNDSSIIGENNDGMIKQINISTHFIDQNKNDNTKISSKIEDTVEIAYLNPDNTPLYDEVPIVYQSSSPPVLTKSELVQHLNTSMLQIDSPIKPLKVAHPDSFHKNSDKIESLTDSNTACHIKSNLMHLQSKTRLDVVTKNVLPQQIPIKSYANTKETLPIETSTKHETKLYVHVPRPNKSNETIVSNSKNTFDSCIDGFKDTEATSSKSVITSAVTNAESISPLAQVSEENVRLVYHSKRTPTTLNVFDFSGVTHLKTPVKSKEALISNSKREIELANSFSEKIVRSAINTKETDNANSANGLKRKSTNDQSQNYSKTPISTSKYKPGPLSKKKRFDNPSETPDQLKIRESNLPNKGHSSILPISMYETFMFNTSAPCCNFFDDPFDEKPTKTDDGHLTKKMSSNDHVSVKRLKQHEQNSRKVNSKKISIHEYKKRSTSERRIDEKAKAKMREKDVTLKKNTVDMSRRTSHVDSDLGYDSDSTVKL